MKIENALEIASKTDPGMVRSYNEDSVAHDLKCGLVVLADGMGGYNAGEVASGIAVSVIVTEICQQLRDSSPTERVYTNPATVSDGNLKPIPGGTTGEAGSHSPGLPKDGIQMAGYIPDVEGTMSLATSRSKMRGGLGAITGGLRRGLAGGEELGVALMRENIKRANSSIYYAAQSQPQYAGMGTTIVSGLFYDNRVVVGHVGDSRMYRLRGETLETITRDHSLLQEQIDSGMISIEDARRSRNRNLVTRAVGIDADVAPEIHVHDVLTGDIYLLCSDGLNDMVEDEDIQSVLYAMQGNLPLAAEQLIQMANDNGGRDNVSVILVKIIGDFAASGGWLAKLLNWLNK